MTKPPVIIRKVIRIGNSIGVTIDRAILDQMGIKPGNWVEVRPGKRKGTLVVGKISKSSIRAAKSSRKTSSKLARTPWLIWYV